MLSRTQLENNSISTTYGIEVKPTERTAVIYARSAVNTPQYDSLEVQLCICRRYCEEQGFKIACEFSEYASGNGVPRMLNEAVRFCEEIEVDAFIVTDISRISGISSQLLQIWDKLEAYSVSILPISHNQTIENSHVTNQIDAK